MSCTGDVVVNSGSTNSAFIAGVASKYTAEFTVAQNTQNAPITTTCTVTVNNVALGTKSITFRGDLAKITAALYAGGKSGSALSDTTTAGRLSYKFYDAAGNRLPYNQTGIGTIALTATASPLITAISVKTNTDVSTTGYVYYNCVDATKSGTTALVLKATNAAGATISANSVDATCSGDVASYTVAMDKSSYNIGDVATLTIKALDLNGKPVNDWDALGTGATVAVSGMTQVAAPATTDTFTAGELAYQYKVDTTAGNFVASVYIPTALVQTTPATAKFSIASTGTQLNDVLAAIVKLIASINKQIKAPAHFGDFKSTRCVSNSSQQAFWQGPLFLHGNHS